MLALEWQFATPGLSQFPQCLEFKLIIDEMRRVRILYSKIHTHTHGLHPPFWGGGLLDGPFRTVRWSPAFVAPGGGGLYRNRSDVPECFCSESFPEQWKHRTSFSSLESSNPISDGTTEIFPLIPLSLWLFLSVSGNRSPSPSGS